MSDAVLGRARELLAQGWTQGTFARDAHGEHVYTMSEDAVVFCPVGALYRAGVELNDHQGWQDGFNRLFGEVGNVASWNDRCDHEDVLHMFDMLLLETQVDAIWQVAA